MPAKDLTSSLRSRIQPNRVPGEAAAAAAAPTPPPAPTHAPPAIPAAELLRKELFVRPDQNDGLARLRRRINAERRAAGDKGPSMTDRILLRVAIDYLLENEASLTGWTEADLLQDLRRAATPTD